MNYLEFFTEGLCKVESIEAFLASPAGFILKEIHGELIHTHENRPNFINVYTDGNNLIVGEAVFYDPLPNVSCIGSIVPKHLNYKTEKNFRGGNSSVGKSLSKFGYFIKHTALPQETVDGVAAMEFFEHTCLGKSSIEAPPEDNVVRVDHHHSYEMTYEYFNADENKIPFYQPEFIKPFLAMALDDVKELFKDNHTLLAAHNPKTWIQRTTEGHELSPHFDGNFNKGISAYINATTWLCPGEFTGREFIAGKRTAEDLSSWVEKAMSSSALNDSSVHELSPSDYVETLCIKPESGKTALINSFNPLFYHGVKKHLGGSPVYSIINDFQHRI